MSYSRSALLLALILAIRPSAADDAISAGEDCPYGAAAGAPRVVTRVIDAETLALDDGSEVRLIGALAPRLPLTAQPGAAWAPEQAAVAGLERLVAGRPVELVSKKSRADRYGRTLANVFVLRDGARLWVQGEMVANGHARAYTLQGGEACFGVLVTRERRAREASVGLWSNPAYAIRRAGDVDQLMRLRSTFQIVEGRVARVSRLRGVVYLNFGIDWRTDFSIGARGKLSLQSVAGGLDLERLEGRSIRVRGWIERRNGPYIAIADWAQLELLEPAADQPRSATATPDR